MVILIHKWQIIPNTCTLLVISMKSKEQQAPTYDVVVIGGGPAGMMAAAYAGERGRSVLLLEKNEKLGKKLLISGGGRCNVTNNTPDVRTMLTRYKDGGKFLFSAFSKSAVKEAIQYFENRNVPLKEENEKRMFPKSDTAKSIHETLVSHMKESGVTVRLRSAVLGIEKGADKLFIISLPHEKIVSRSVVLATGGTSRPETGSTGEGIGWLKKLGHTTIANNFALVPVALHDSWAKKLGGVALTDVKLTLFADGKSDKKKSAKIGKLLFTHFGVSGPTILNMSKEIGEMLSESEVTLMVDIFPKLDHAELREKLKNLLSLESNKMLKNTLRNLVPSGLVAPLIELVGADGETPNHSVSTETRKALVSLLKAIPLHPSHLLGAEKAVVSAGGVALEEVDFKTMESRIVPNLYLVGDVLNVDRPSGGYSLQLCWTTGFVAGSHI